MEIQRLKLGIGYLLIKFPVGLSLSEAREVLKLEGLSPSSKADMRTIVDHRPDDSKRSGKYVEIGAKIRKNAPVQVIGHRDTTTTLPAGTPIDRIPKSEQQQFTLGKSDGEFEPGFPQGAGPNCWVLAYDAKDPEIQNLENDEAREFQRQEEKANRRGHRY